MRVPARNQLNSFFIIIVFSLPCISHKSFTLGRHTSILYLQMLRSITRTIIPFNGLFILYHQRFQTNLINNNDDY